MYQSGYQNHAQKVNILDGFFDNAHQNAHQSRILGSNKAAKGINKNAKKGEKDTKKGEKDAKKGEKDAKKGANDVKKGAEKTEQDLNNAIDTMNADLFQGLESFLNSMIPCEATDCTSAPPVNTTCCECIVKTVGTAAEYLFSEGFVDVLRTTIAYIMDQYEDDLQQGVYCPAGQYFANQFGLDEDIGCAIVQDLIDTTIDPESLLVLILSKLVCRCKINSDNTLDCTNLYSQGTLEAFECDCENSANNNNNDNSDNNSDNNSDVDIVGSPSMDSSFSRLMLVPGKNHQFDIVLS